MNRKEFDKKISECHSGSQAHQVCNKYIEHLEKQLNDRKIFDDKDISPTSKMFLVSSINFEELQRMYPDRNYCSPSFCEGFRSGMKFAKDIK